MIASLDLVEVGDHIEVLQVVRLLHMRVKLGAPPLLPPLALNPPAHTKRNDGRGERHPANRGLPDPRTTHGRLLVQPPQRALDKSERRFDARLAFYHFPHTRVGPPFGTAVRTGRDVRVESRLLRLSQTAIQPLVKLFSDCLATHSFLPFVETPHAVNGFTGNSREAFLLASGAPGAAVIS